jgi:glucose/arabinose dehydrogenase
VDGAIGVHTCRHEPLSEGDRVKCTLAIAALCATAGCGAVTPTQGGGMTEGAGPRRIAPEDVALAPGYAIEVVARGLTFPTSVAFDDQGQVYVVEAGYSYGEVFRTPKLLRIDANGQPVTVASGEQNGPWTGVVFRQGKFYVAEGGVMKGGRLLSIDGNGAITPLIESLPTGGDHHANGPTLGPDGKLYFALGTMTNSGVVGPDNFDFGWLKRHPDWHDVPCRDVVLTGENFESADPLKGGDSKATTGAFSPFGTSTQPGQKIAGKVPCSGAVLRMSTTGGEPELVAWGFRNPFGLAFARDGKLLVTDNGYDVRGSRPIWGNADWLWVVDTGKPPLWHGWPDYADGRKVAQDRYKATGEDAPRALLAELPNEPPLPRAFFATHSSSNGLDVSRSSQFGHVGEAFVAQFGDQAPVTGKTVSPAGFKVVRVDLSNGVIEEFAVNRGDENGPASFLESGGLERPVAVRFSPDGSALYVVDFGVLRMSEKQSLPREGTGVLWRITRRGAS